MSNALFWVVTHGVVVIPNRLFGTPYSSHLHGSRILTREDGTPTLPHKLSRRVQAKIYFTFMVTVHSIV